MVGKEIFNQLHVLQHISEHVEKLQTSYEKPEKLMSNEPITSEVDYPANFTRRQSSNIRNITRKNLSTRQSSFRLLTELESIDSQDTREEAQFEHQKRKFLASQPPTSLPFHLQGDRTFNEQQCLNKRQALRQSSQIEKQIKELWNITYRNKVHPKSLQDKDTSNITTEVQTVNTPDILDTASNICKADIMQQSSAPNIPEANNMQINEHEYSELMLLIYKSLRADFQLEVAKEQIHQDWDVDSHHEATLAYVAFFNSIFELVDVWTCDIQEATYVRFLELLVKRITVRVVIYIDDSKVRLATSDNFDDTIIVKAIPLNSVQRFTNIARMVETKGVRTIGELAAADPQVLEETRQAYVEKHMLNENKIGSSLKHLVAMFHQMGHKFNKTLSNSQHINKNEDNIVNRLDDGQSIDVLDERQEDESDDLQLINSTIESELASSAHALHGQSEQNPSVQIKHVQKNKRWLKREYEQEEIRSSHKLPNPGVESYDFSKDSVESDDDSWSSATDSLENLNTNIRSKSQDESHPDKTKKLMRRKKHSRKLENLVTTIHDLAHADELNIDALRTAILEEKKISLERKKDMADIAVELKKLGFDLEDFTSDEAARRQYQNLYNMLIIHESRYLKSIACDTISAMEDQIDGHLSAPLAKAKDVEHVYDTLYDAIVKNSGQSIVRDAQDWITNCLVDEEKEWMKLYVKDMYPELKPVEEVVTIGVKSDSKDDFEMLDIIGDISYGNKEETQESDATLPLNVSSPLSKLDLAGNPTYESSHKLGELLPELAHNSNGFSCLEPLPVHIVENGTSEKLSVKYSRAKKKKTKKSTHDSRIKKKETKAKNTHKPQSNKLVKKVKSTTVAGSDNSDAESGKSNFEESINHLITDTNHSSSTEEMTSEISIKISPEIAKSGHLNLKSPDPFLTVTVNDNPLKIDEDRDQSIEEKEKEGEINLLKQDGLRRYSRHRNILKKSSVTEPSEYTRKVTSIHENEKNREALNIAFEYDTTNTLIQDSSYIKAETIPKLPKSKVPKILISGLSNSDQTISKQVRYLQLLGIGTIQAVTEFDDLLITLASEQCDDETDNTTDLVCLGVGNRLDTVVESVNKLQEAARQNISRLYPLAVILFGGSTEYESEILRLSQLCSNNGVIYIATLPLDFPKLRTEIINYFEKSTQPKYIMRSRKQTMSFPRCVAMSNTISTMAAGYMGTNLELLHNDDMAIARRAGKPATPKSQNRPRILENNFNESTNVVKEQTGSMLPSRTISPRASTGIKQNGVPTSDIVSPIPANQSPPASKESSVSPAIPANSFPKHSSPLEQHIGFGSASLGEMTGAFLVSHDDYTTKSRYPTAKLQNHSLPHAPISLQRPNNRKSPRLSINLKNLLR